MNCGFIKVIPQNFQCPFISNLMTIGDLLEELIRKPDFDMTTKT